MRRGCWARNLAAEREFAFAPFLLVLFTGAVPHLLQVLYKVLFRSLAQMTFSLNFGE
jgi:hypothetical protein